jgi:predicted dithiol-disulfide oxidoreductase (DUF899 family)
VESLAWRLKAKEIHMATKTARFPGESRAYRTARNKLLDAELKLRKQVERVAALRRKLPPGGKVPHDYEFEEEGGRKVRLSQLFERGKNTLILYSYMYGPKMEKPCPMCTSFLDSLDGAAPHIVQRASLAVVARSPIERILEFTRSRGWRNLRLLSSAGNTYNRDYHGEASDGSQMPSLNVFIRRSGVVRHFFHTELMFAKAEKGQNQRHIDMAWPLWNVLDFTPEGRGDWYPKLEYSTK